MEDKEPNDRVTLPMSAVCVELSTKVRITLSPSNVMRVTTFSTVSPFTTNTCVLSALEGKTEKKAKAVRKNNSLFILVLSFFIAKIR
jgi:hypothetical protein